MSFAPPKYGSDHIQGVDYDEATSTLMIRFHKGGAYAYEGVSPDVFEKLHGAGSPSSFFRSNIRGRFKHRKI